MSIKISCPHCQRAYTLSDTQQGKTIRCKECKETFQVGAGVESAGAAKKFAIKKIDFDVVILMSYLLIFSVGAVVCIGLAVAYWRDEWKGVGLLAGAGILGFFGVLMAFGTRRYLVFYWCSMRKSAAYLMKYDMLLRIDRTGSILEQLPYANIKRFRLRAGASGDGEGFQYIGIKIKKMSDRDTIVDPYGTPWSREWGYDLVIHSAFLKGSFDDVYDEFQAQQDAWSRSAAAEAAVTAAGSRSEKDDPDAQAEKKGRRRDRDDEDETPRSWYQKPLVYVFGLLGIVGLIGLGWLLNTLLTPQDAAVVKGPNPKPQQPGQNVLEKRNPEAIPGLIAYWPLDEAKGTSTHDKLGAIPGVLKGGEWIGGVKGGGLRFNGTSDFVDLGGDVRLNFAPGAPFTLAGWTATDADQGVICSFRKMKGFGVISVLVVKGNVRGWVRDDTSGFGGVQITGGPIKDGKWRHFALARHPDGLIELFLDGVFQGRDKGKASGAAITTDLRALGSDRFVVTTGKQGPAYFAGSIDEVCLYNRVLSPEEIGALAGK